MNSWPSGPTQGGEIFQQDRIEVWISPGTNRTLRCVEDCLQIEGGPFRMVVYAFPVDKWSCKLHEVDGWHPVTIHQLICNGILGWHLDLQLELERTPPQHLTGSPNTTVTQVVCQFGEMHFWHHLGSLSGIHYWWTGGSCGSNEDPSHLELSSPNHSDRVAKLFGSCQFQQ